MLLEDMYVFFAQYDNEHATAEIFLWRCVLHQALLDALAEVNSPLPHPAIAWFSISHRDFITVCTYAGVDPYNFCRLVDTILASPEQWKSYLLSALQKRDYYMRT